MYLMQANIIRYLHFKQVYLKKQVFYCISLIVIFVKLHSYTYPLYS